MNQEIKRQWVEALRSGKFTQGRRLLCRINTDDGSKTHCCLGVLCDILKIPSSVDDSDPDALQYGPEKDISILPKIAVQLAGLSNPNPRVFVTPYGTTYETNLASLNDSGKTFLEIADLIEAQL
jgi:hypothetical protein